MKLKERTRLLKIYGQLFERLYIEEQGHCFYCNSFQESLDHVPPLAWLEVYGIENLRKDQIPFSLVPCCTECNNLLGDKKLMTVPDRLDFLENKYLSLYNKITAWSDDEIMEMGQSFQKSLQRFKARAGELSDKIDAVRQRAYKPWTHPEACLTIGKA